MKKTLITFLVIIAALFAGLTFMGRNGDYRLQKEMWKINKQFDEISKDPKAVPESAFKEVAEDYDRLAGKYKDSDMVPLIQMLSARANMFIKEYDMARGKLEQVVEANKNNSFGAQALAEIGRSYALEGNREAILANYQRMLKDFRFTEIGLKTPIYIAKHYAEHNEPEKARQAFNDALEAYQEMIEKNPDTVLAINAKKLKATCYGAQERWIKAVDELKSILLDSKPELLTPAAISSVIKSINNISVAKLKSFDVPIQIYKEFIYKYPDQPLSKALQKMIDGFEVLKEKGVSFTTPEEEK